MRNILKVSIMLLILVLSIIGCSKIEQKKYSDEIIIIVDSLLTTIISDSLTMDIEFAIPNNWEKAPVEILDVLYKNNLSQNNIIQNIVPLNAYNDSLNKNICILSTYNKLDKGKTFIEEYQNVIKKDFKSDKIKINYFSNNNLNFCQILLFNATYINIKLIFEQTNKIYIYEYLVTKQYYKENIKIIESSIGQLKRRK